MTTNYKEFDEIIEQRKREGVKIIDGEGRGVAVAIAFSYAFTAMWARYFGKPREEGNT